MEISRRPFVEGGVVRLLPDFQDPGDDEFTCVVMTEEEKERVDISPVDIPMNIKPWSTVQVT